MSQTKTVLVAGVTGQQGGSAVDALLERGHKVIGLTRNPDSDRAAALRARGVTIAKGDFSHPESITAAAAAAGADAAYAMSTPFETGTDSEISQGRTLIDALAAANVGHIVFGSVASADKATSIPHFDSKFVVEQHLASLGIPYSIVAPVYFMDNLLSPWALPALQDGKFAAAMPANRKLQQVAVRDIGTFAAALIERADSVFGKRFDIAGDELTGSDAAAILTKATGRPIRYEGFSPDVLRSQSEDFALMFEWFDDTGYSADIAALRRDFADVPWATFEDWANGQDWSVLDNMAA